MTVREPGVTIVEARAGGAVGQVEIHAVRAEEWAATGWCVASRERCNRYDDDCDGAIDEADAATCRPPHP